MSSSKTDQHRGKDSRPAILAEQTSTILLMKNAPNSLDNIGNRIKSDPPTLDKCAKGICLGNLLWSTQPNDRETVIEG